MLGFANDEDRTRCVAHHLFSDASKPEMFDAAITVSGNNDEVSADFFRDVINLERGLTVSHQEVHRNRRGNFPGGECGQFCRGVRPLRKLVCAEIGPGQFGDGIVTLADVQEGEARTKLFCEWNRVLQCLFRAGRKINRHENAPDFEQGQCRLFGLVASRSEWLVMRRFKRSAAPTASRFHFHICLSVTALARSLDARADSPLTFTLRLRLVPIYTFFGNSLAFPAHQLKGNNYQYSTGRALRFDVSYYEGKEMV